MNLISEKRVDIYRYHRLFRSRDPNLPFVGYARYVSRQDTRVHLHPTPLDLTAKYSFAILLPISRFASQEKKTYTFDSRSREKNWILLFPLSLSLFSPSTTEYRGISFAGIATVTSDTNLFVYSRPRSGSASKAADLSARSSSIRGETRGEAKERVDGGGGGKGEVSPRTNRGGRRCVGSPVFDFVLTCRHYGIRFGQPPVEKAPSWSWISITVVMATAIDSTGVSEDGRRERRERGRGTVAQGYSRCVSASEREL